MVINSINYDRINNRKDGPYFKGVQMLKVKWTLRLEWRTFDVGIKTCLLNNPKEGKLLLPLLVTIFTGRK